jgi:hypothetical protein
MCDVSIVSRWVMVLALGVLGALAAAYPDPAAAQETPIAAYSFEEGEGAVANDSAGAHDGTLHGAEWTEAGKFGGALRFDPASSARLTIPASPELNLSGPFTLEAWVKPEAAGQSDPIFAKTEADGTLSYLLYSANGEGKPQATITDGADHWSVPTGTEALPQDAWSHLAVVSDGEDTRLFVNGKVVATEPSYTPQGTEAPLRIGGIEAWGHYFDGTIDNIRIFDRALSAGEVTKGSEESVPPAPGPPIAAYSFEEGEGAVANDSAGAHDGTLHGAEWTEAGKFGGALRFDPASSARLTIPASPELNLSGPFTLEAWVKPEAAGQSDPIFAKTEADGTLSYLLYSANGEGKPQATITDGADHWSVPTGTEALPQDAWSHLAVVSDGEDTRLFVNGKVVATEPSYTPQGTEAPLRIGGIEAWGHYFDGTIDEVRIYDRVLSATELTKDSVTSLPPNTQLVTKPAGSTNNVNFTFEYLSSDPLSTFECRVDRSDWEVCPKRSFVPPPLKEGPHTFEVRARNAIGFDPTQARATFVVDTTRPSLSFDSELSGQRQDYSLTASSQDPGDSPSGVERIDVLLDGVLAGSASGECAAGICSASLKKPWSHHFPAPLDGSHRLTVLAVDSAGNVASSAFDLPSEVIHASIFTGNPSAGGLEIGQEWAVLGTHHARREASGETTTRGIAACPTGTEGLCAVLRSNKPSANGDIGFSEATKPLVDADALSEGATLLVPTHTAFGAVTGNGAISSILHSWQVLPPGHGSTYTKLEAGNEADEFSLQGNWTFWIDDVTGMPIKGSLQSDGSEPEVSYYTYKPSPEEAGDLRLDLFLQKPPSSSAGNCLPSGKLGSWSFSMGGFVNPDPEFTSMVNVENGMIHLLPEGAARDGYDGRADLTAGGVEIHANAADAEQVQWEVNDTPDQILEPAGANVILESEDGSPVAVIQPGSSEGVEVIDGEPNAEEAQSEDRVVLDPAAGAAATISKINGVEGRSKPCVTTQIVEEAEVTHQEAIQAKAATLGPKPSGSGATTPVVVWINPHPALKGVTVSDKYGTCNAPHSKTFGEDGRVEFGGCPVGKSVTLTVPNEVTVGNVRYTIGDPSRSFNPPSGGWRVEFNYSGQTLPSPEPPPPPPAEDWFHPLEVRVEEEEVGENSEASTSSALGPPPTYVCIGRLSRPFRTTTALEGATAAEAWWRFRCGPKTYVDYWYVPDFRLESNPGRGWVVRAKKSIHGPGPAFDTAGPFVALALCNGTGVRLGLERGPHWRAAGELHVISEVPTVELPHQTHTREKRGIYCG